MFNERQKRRWRDGAYAALGRLRLAEQAISSRVGPPRIGDVYVFRTADEIRIRWAVVSVHPDEPDLLFIVPADDHPMHGGTDISLASDQPIGPLVLRCALGIWVLRRDFAAAVRVGILPDRTCAAARKLLSTIFDSTSEDCLEQSHIDDDPEYEQWCGEIEQSVERLRSQLDSAGQGEPCDAPILYISLHDFTHQWPFPEHDSQLSAETLAAASSGLVGRVESIIHQATEPPLMHSLPVPADGRLFACSDGQEVYLLYLCAATEPAPEIAACDESSAWRILQWRASPNGQVFRAFPALVWRQNQIQLRFALGQTIIIDKHTS
jgi:hypothetical protein